MRRSGLRKGSDVPLKQIVDEAVETCRSIGHVVVLRRGEEEPTMRRGRDIYWEEFLAGAEGHSGEVAWLEPAGPAGEKGIMVIRTPFPGLTATLWGEADRYARDYWQRIPGQDVYFSGDSRVRPRRLPVVQRPGRRNHQDRRPPPRHYRGGERLLAPPCTIVGLYRDAWLPIDVPPGDVACVNG